MVMRILTTMLKQKAVLWESPVPDGYGKYTYDDPQEIKVRWQKKGELFTDKDGEEVLSDATVFTAVDIDIGSYMWLGELSSLTAAQRADPETVGRRVRATEKIPTLDATQFLRKAFL